MLHRLHAAAAVRLRELTTPERRDLGEGPVPYIIMVALIAAVAVAVGAAILAIANGWIAQVPKN
jgi:hypothetical protein